MVNPVARQRRRGLKAVAIAGSATAAVNRILVSSSIYGLTTETQPNSPGRGPAGASYIVPMTKAHTGTLQLYGFPQDLVGNLLSGVTLSWVASSVTMASAALGASSVVLSATTMTGSVKAGDQLSILGNTYFVSGTAAASGNAVTAAIVPNLITAVPANTPVTYTAGSTAGSLAQTGGFQTNGAIAQGATTLTLGAVTTLTGSVVVGDQIAISGTTYYATAGASATSNAISVQVQPPVPALIATHTVYTYTKNTGGTLSPTATGSVNSSGLVSGSAAGQCVITATANGKISNSFFITFT